MNKRWIGLLIATLALLGPTLSAGSAATQQERPEGTVTFGFWGAPEELAAYEELIAAFSQAEPGVTVAIDHVPGSDEFYARLTTGFAAGDPPDVFLINYRRYGQFAARGVLDPIGPLLRDSELISEDDFYTEPMDAFRWNDDLMCLPQNVSSLVVYYNRELFEAAGVPVPTSGWTWEDFLTAAQTLTQDFDGDGITDQHGLGVENSIVRFAPFIWAAGGELVDDTDNPTTLTVDTPEARAGIQFFIDLSLKHKVVPTEPEVLAEDDESRFMNGTTAMLLQSRRVVPMLRQIDGFTWDVAPLPVGQESAGLLHSDAYCLTTTAEDKDAAWSFIQFANSAEGQAVIARTGRTVPSLISVANSPAFLGIRALSGDAGPIETPQIDLGDRFDPPASSHVFLDTIPDLRRLPTISTWPEVEDAFNANLGRAFYGEIEIDAAIAVTTSRAEDIFERGARDAGR